VFLWRPGCGSRVLMITPKRTPLCNASQSCVYSASCMRIVGMYVYVLCVVGSLMVTWSTIHSIPPSSHHGSLNLISPVLVRTQTMSIPRHWIRVKNWMTGMMSIPTYWIRVKNWIPPHPLPRPGLLAFPPPPPLSLWPRPPRPLPPLPPRPPPPLLPPHPGLLAPPLPLPPRPGLLGLTHPPRPPRPPPPSRPPPLLVVSLLCNVLRART
jgi:hypothetical protein